MTERVFDIVALAQAIRKRIEVRREHGVHIVVTPHMSRILENDDEYIPYRRRKEKRKRRYASTNPTIRTLVAIAVALDTTVGELLGERPEAISREERAKFVGLGRFLVRRFGLQEGERR